MSQKHSSNELLPIRLAPFRPVKVVSPIEARRCLVMPVLDSTTLAGTHNGQPALRDQVAAMSRCRESGKRRRRSGRRALVNSSRSLAGHPVRHSRSPGNISWF